MPPRTRIAFIVLFSLAAAGAALSIAIDSLGDWQPAGSFLDDETSYAELSTTSLQGLPASAPSEKKLNLPILVYHIVRPSYPSDDAAVRALALTPQTFDAEMSYLQTAGYHVVRFSDLENYFENGAPLPSNPVIISFDDGWGDQFAYAFPLLKKHHYPATFFVFTNAVGRRGFLSWNELRALVAAGMTIGSHSESHPFLTRISDPAALWNEIDGSKQILEQRLGISINEFAYPFGAYDPAVVAMIRKAGYRSARGDFFSGEQTADRLYELSALNAPTTTPLFEKQLPLR